MALRKRTTGNHFKGLREIYFVNFALGGFVKAEGWEGGYDAMSVGMMLASILTKLVVERVAVIFIKDTIMMLNIYTTIIDQN